MCDRNHQIEILYEKYRKALFFHIKAQFWFDEQTCFDAVQNVFLRAHKTWRTEYQNRNPYPWLKKIARSVSVDLARAKNRRPVLAQVSPVGLDPNSDEWMLEHCLNRLSGDDRELVLQKCAAGATWEELSEITGISVGSLRHRLQKTVRKLARCMEYSKKVG